ncbi:MAG: hypothetical protein Q9163_004937 [Psora crenata]
MLTPPRTGPLPTLKAIILDFSSVNNIDITSVQHLIDVRNQLDKYAAPDKVDWHLACINNRWTKRALASAGFGYPTPENDGETPLERWKPIFSVATAAECIENEKPLLQKQQSPDIEQAASHSSNSGSDFSRNISTTKPYDKSGTAAKGKVAVVHGLNRPLFHIDLTSALQSAVANVEKREHEQETKKGVGTKDT